MASVQPAQEIGTRRRACQTCARLKEKCVVQTNETACRRCQRLQKECIFSNEPRKRQRTTTAQDESLLSSGLPTPAPSTSTSENAFTTDNLMTSKPPFAPISPNISPSETITSFDTTRKNSLYDDFLNDLNRYYPFLVADDDCRSAKACEQHLPFTFAACLVAALHRQPTVQKRASREMLNYIGVAMLMDGKKSLDLAQGLLLLIAWYQYHTQRNPQLMNLLYLVKALLVDLGLSRSQTTHTLTGIMSSDIPQLMHGPAIQSPSYCLAGYRCALAVYYIEAQISLAFHWLDYPRWNNHLEECSQKLLAAQASPLDQYSYHVVHIYHTIERYVSMDGLMLFTSSQIQSYIDSFREDLGKIRSSLPPKIASEKHIQIHLVNFEVALYDTATTTRDDESHPAQILEALHMLLAHIHSFFDLFLAQPPEQFPFFTFLHYCQSSYAIDVLGRLSFLKLPGWDLKQVRESAGMVSIIDRIVDKFDEVFIADLRRFPLMEYSRFATYSTKLRQCKKWFEERVAKEANEVDGEGQRSSNSLSNAGFEAIDSFPDSLSDALWMWPMDEFRW